MHYKSAQYLEDIQEICNNIEVPIIIAITANHNISPLSILKIFKKFVITLKFQLSECSALLVMEKGS